MFTMSLRNVAPDGVAAVGNTTFIVLNRELPRVLTNNFNIVPAEALKSSPGNFTERWREIDQINT